MRAAVLEHFGGTPTRGEMEEPAAGPGEALVEVAMAALNPVDLKVATGAFYGASPDLPYVVGSEGMGVVRASGRWPVGQRVRFGAARPGALAEFVAVPDDQLVAVPDAVSDALAAGLGVAGMAAWCSLAAARLHEGERVLVLGATGSVGRLAVQVARLLGATRVVAAGRDAEALASLVELGAHATVAIDDRDAPALADAIVEASEGPPDVIVDPLWGDPALAGAMSAAPGARLVNLGDSAGATLSLPSALLRSRHLEILGYTNFALSVAEQRSVMESLLHHAGEGRLRFDHVAVVLGEVSRAWAAQAGSPHAKVLVRMKDA
ncbi:MAG: quinone oxidoreductase family protein [Acidimicrobiales bacterium]